MKRTTIAAVAAFALLLGGCVTVDAGEVVVPVGYGDPGEPMTDPGISGRNPFHDMVSYPTRPQEIAFSASAAQRAAEDSNFVGYGPIKVLTSEGATVDLDLSVLVYVDESKALDVYSNVGQSWETVIRTQIHPRTEAVAQQVLPQFDFEDARTSRRADAQAAILEALSADLEPKGILVDAVLIRSMPAPAELQSYINERINAEADLREAEIREEQAVIEARTLQTQRKAEADAKIIDAESAAEAQLLRANATAAENRTISESLTPELLQKFYYEALAGATLFLGEGGDVLVEVPATGGE